MSGAFISIRTHAKAQSQTQHQTISLPATIVVEVERGNHSSRVMIKIDRACRLSVSGPDERRRP